MPDREFSMDDQRQFAQLSGDYNELHLDDIAARRSMFGSPVVHGVNLLLWALDCYMPADKGRCDITSLKVLFTHQVKVGDAVRIEALKVSPESIRLKLFVGTTAVVTIKAGFTAGEPGREELLLNSYPPQEDAIEVKEADVPGTAGELDLHLNALAAQTLYPNLAVVLNPLQLAAILGSTRIVGMFCPGRYSLFSELALKSSADSTINKLRYSVTDIDERFGLIEMQFAAPGFTGVIGAFRRPEPQAQESFTELRSQVTDGEFAGQRALIIGGSRGLGEVTAKLLAAGGADVTVTYNKGHAEAAFLVDDIVSGGGQASACQFDVLDLSGAEQLPAPTHLYYFATPFITPGIPDHFSEPLFQKFCDYYVTALDNLTQVLVQTDMPHIFSPSSVYLDEQPDNLQEYTLAKLEAEKLCGILQAANPARVVSAPRLPRMATDQTANVAAVANDDPVPVMLEELRKFAKLSH